MARARGAGTATTSLNHLAFAAVLGLKAVCILNYFFPKKSSNYVQPTNSWKWRRAYIHWKPAARIIPRAVCRLQSSRCCAAQAMLPVTSSAVKPTLMCKAYIPSELPSELLGFYLFMFLWKLWKNTQPDGWENSGRCQNHFRGTAPLGLLQFISKKLSRGGHIETKKKKKTITAADLKEHDE